MSAIHCQNPWGYSKGTNVKQWYGIQQVSRDVRHTLALYTDSTLEGAAYHDLKDRNPITHQRHGQRST